MEGLHRAVRPYRHHVLPGIRQLRRTQRLLQQRGSLSAVRQRHGLLVLQPRRGCGRGLRQLARNGRHRPRERAHGPQERQDADHLGKQPHHLAHAHHALLLGGQGERHAPRGHRPGVQCQRLEGRLVGSHQGRHRRRPGSRRAERAAGERLDRRRDAARQDELRTPHQGGRHVPAHERAGRGAHRGRP